MEFDKTRVYTAVNADELKVGSRCIFADNLKSLRNKIQEVENYALELTGIKEDCETYRFNHGDDEHALAYLVEPPQEPEYQPFSSVEKAKEIIDKHGGWVKDRATKEIILVTSYTGKRINERDNEVIFIGSCWYSLNELYHNFVFADDGSPCGELVEE